MTSSSLHCDLCSVGFPVEGRLPHQTKWKVFSHWLTHHTGGSSAEALRLRRNRIHRQRLGPEGAVCDECSKRFMDLDSLVEHFAAEHGLGSPRRARPKPQLLCDLCGKSVHLRFQLHLHHLRHHVGKIIEARKRLSRSCDDCARGFPSRYALFRHWLSRHSVMTQAEAHRALGLRRYAAKWDPASRCDDCGRCYGSREALVRHTCGGRPSAFYKTIRKPTFCDLCGRNIKKHILFKHQARCSKPL